MFRPTFENLESREVFSGEPLPMEEVRLIVPGPSASGFVSHTLPAADGLDAAATSGGSYTLAIGPNVVTPAGDRLLAGTYGRGLTADFNGDSVDGGDFLAWQRGVVGDFNNDGRPDLAIKSPRDSASGQAIELAANFVDDLLGWDFRSRTIDHEEPTVRAAHDEAFEERGGNGIIAVLIGLVHKSPDRIVVDPSDTSGNTFVQRRASVTDLTIDPFDRNILIGTDGGVWRMQLDRG